MEQKQEILGIGVLVFVVLTSLIISCLAITGHVEHGNKSIPVKAVDMDKGFNIPHHALTSSLSGTTNVNTNGLSLGGISVGATASDLNRLTGASQGPNDSIGTNALSLKGGTGYLTLEANPNTTTTFSLTFPENSGSANQVLKSDGSGTLFWGGTHEAPSADKITLASDDVTIKTTGAGKTLKLSSASTTTLEGQTVDIKSTATTNEIFFKSNSDANGLKFSEANTGDWTISPQTTDKSLILSPNGTGDVQIKLGNTASTSVFKVSNSTPDDFFTIGADGKIGVNTTPSTAARQFFIKSTSTNIPLELETDDAVQTQGFIRFGASTTTGNNIQTFSNLTTVPGSDGHKIKILVNNEIRFIYCYPS